MSPYFRAFFKAARFLILTDSGHLSCFSLSFCFNCCYFQHRLIFIRLLFRKNIWVGKGIQIFLPCFRFFAHECTWQHSQLSCYPFNYFYAVCWNHRDHSIHIETRPLPANSCNYWIVAKLGYFAMCKIFSSIQVQPI